MVSFAVQKLFNFTMSDLLIVSFGAYIMGAYFLFYQVQDIWIYIESLDVFGTDFCRYGSTLAGSEWPGSMKQMTAHAS